MFEESIVLLGHAPSMAYIGSPRTTPSLEQAKHMSETLLDMLRRKAGPEPATVKLAVEEYKALESNTFALICRYNPESSDARRYIAKLLTYRHADWDPQAKNLLLAS